MIGFQITQEQALLRPPHFNDIGLNSINFLSDDEDVQKEF